MFFLSAMYTFPMTGPAQELGGLAAYHQAESGYQTSRNHLFETKDH